MALNHLRVKDRGDRISSHRPIVTVLNPWSTPGRKPNQTVSRGTQMGEGALTQLMEIPFSHGEVLDMDLRLTSDLQRALPNPPPRVHRHLAAATIRDGQS